MKKTWKWIQPFSEELYKDKYGLRGESIEEAFKDISKIVSNGEKDKYLFFFKLKNKKRDYWQKQFYDSLINRRLVPAGRIMANARLDSKMKCYSNCFTLPIEDSIEGIYSTLKNDALIGKVGGGVGIEFSTLRPNQTQISKGGKSSGVISFMKVFNESAKIIVTGGNRRAAHIGLLKGSHPEIESFITIKQGDKNKELTQFNISVKISDKFMEAVESDSDWNLEFKGKIYKTIKARDLLDQIAKNAYIHNEPGVFFEDTVEKYNNAYYTDLKLDCVNPCGELPLPSKGGNCNLSHLYLPAYINNAFEKDASFDFQEFSKDVAVAVRFLDDLTDINEYPIKLIQDNAINYRRIGLGFTGLADAFAMLGYKYGDRDSKNFSVRLGRALRDSAYDASAELAKEKGKFPKCNNKKISKAKFVKMLPRETIAKIRKYGLRNVGLLTIAPCGTNSMTLGQNCSSGIEPIVSIGYTRTIRTGKGDETRKEKVYNNAWLEYIKWYKENNPKVKEEDIEVPEIFKHTLESGTINVYDEIKIQAILQRYIDHSISKTCNLPKGFTFDDYKRLFVHAWKLGLKGWTSFNAWTGSMKGIFEIEGLKKEDEKSCSCERYQTIEPRGESLPCDIYETKKDDKIFLVLVGLKHNCPYEIFVGDNTKGKIDIEKHKTGIIRRNGKGSYDLIVNDGEEKVIIEDIAKTLSNNVYGTMTRLLSLPLRGRINPADIAEQLTKDSQFISFERAVARVLKKYAPENREGKESDGDVCEVCGDKMIFSETCKKCKSCGWSKCE